MGWPGRAAEAGEREAIGPFSGPAQPGLLVVREDRERDVLESRGAHDDLAGHRHSQAHAGPSAGTHGAFPAEAVKPNRLASDSLMQESQLRARRSTERPRPGSTGDEDVALVAKRRGARRDAVLIGQVPEQLQLEPTQLSERALVFQSVRLAGTALVFGAWCALGGAERVQACCNPA